MRLRFGLTATLGLLLAAGSAAAQATRQAQPWRGSTDGPAPATQPTQPPSPQHPTLQRRSPAVTQPAARLQLTPQQEQYLDRVLQAWEQRSAGVKTFACRFTRWEYDLVFAETNTHPNSDPAKTPIHTEEGEIRYGRPDRGMFRVLYTQKNGQMVPVDDDRAEHWICDGKSIHEYRPERKEVVEHKLPPHLQGKAITNGPLPFLFGSQGVKLKQRYFMQIITPPEVQNEQIWLRAFPRYQQDAADFARAELILSIKDLTPHGLQIFFPNGKTRHAYQFFDVVTNDPLGFLKGNPFHARTPLGWKKVVEEPPAGRVGQRPTTTGKR